MRKKPGPPKGKRYGGKPKGYKAPHTMEKLEMQKQFRERITSEFGPLMEALIAKAKGVHHMVAREKDGKWTEVTDPAKMIACLNSGETFYRIYAHDPDAKALADVFNRVMGMPTQEVELEVKTSARELSDEDLIAQAKTLVDQMKANARVH